jgi:hypothetical protein
MMHRVKIGPQFFAKAKNDYANWHWAWVREINQNSIDAAGCTEVHFTTRITEDGNTEVIVRNNGEPMTREILVDKLLALGESGKNFEGTVGGFGKAKELLMLTHLNWAVSTGGLRAAGEGGEYALEEAGWWYGTETTVTMEGNQEEELHRMFRRFCLCGQWSGTFYWNGEAHKATQYKGSPRRDMGWAKVYTNKSRSNIMIVRIGGIPMFTRWVDVDRCVIVELEGTSADVLTSNRDGLTGNAAEELSSFTTELAVDKKKALKRSRNPLYRRYAGRKLRHESIRQDGRDISVRDLVGAEPAAGGRPDLAEVTNEGAGNGINGIGDGPDAGPAYHEDEHGGGYRAAAYSGGGMEIRQVATLGQEFIIKNETDLIVPAMYRPDSGEFSKYSQKLVRIWGRLLLEMHKLFDREDEFALGFIFDEDSEAEHETGQFGRVYYLSPCKIVEQKSSYSRSFRKRFKLTQRNRLLMIALHEFIHGLGLDYHNEEYANKLTDMAWKVWDNRSRFNWCFK